jgi:peptide/nickel transport system ATP-binding protein
MALEEQTARKTDEADPIITAEDVSVEFNMERGTSRVLDHVNIDVQRNEILGVVGESGSGKSMFADALLDAVVEPGQLRGDITYHPEGEEPIDLLDLSDEELREFRWDRAAMVFQGAMNSFNPTQTIRGHFEETLKAHDHNVADGLEHARELLADLYMPPERVLKSYPHELSGGMQQRALIALSLVLDPDVLVMDEPTAALDLLMQRSILSLLEQVKERYDLTIVFITHDLPLVTGLADRVAVLYAFDFVEVGDANTVFSDPSHPYTRALLRSVPSLNTPLDEITPIEGSAPDPVDLPSGCKYHPRCPLADEQCRQEKPGFHADGGDEDHVAACFYIDEAKDAIEIPERREKAELAEREGKQSAEPVISMKDLEVHFETEAGGIVESLRGESETVRAVDGVNLDIYENDVVTLVGESGCGKTTLGKASIGAQRPTGGTLEFRGQDFWEAKDRDSGLSIPFIGDNDREEGDLPFGSIRRALQIIHQDPGSSLNPNRTVKANLEVPLKKWHNEMNFQDREERILAMLEYVGMTPPDDYALRYPHQLSGGEKQRVALIRAMLMNPAMIFADEAVSALDVSLRVEVMNLMLKLQDVFNTSYLFTSHNLSNARYLSASVGGRIAVMYLGQIVEIGPAEQVIHNSKHPYTEVLKWATEDVDESQSVEESPIRKIDIPDPINPPSGCSFHTRCPDAREACKQEEPGLEHEDVEHKAACFKEYPDSHAYWDSEPLPEIEEEDESGAAIADD